MKAFIEKAMIVAAAVTIVAGSAVAIAAYEYCIANNVSIAF
jgi:hypothetical protein